MVNPEVVFAFLRLPFGGAPFVDEDLFNAQRKEREMTTGQPACGACLGGGSDILRSGRPAAFGDPDGLVGTVVFF